MAFFIVLGMGVVTFFSTSTSLNVKLDNPIYQRDYTT